jgi:hypothetical protein
VNTKLAKWIPNCIFLEPPLFGGGGSTIILRLHQ